MQLITDSSSLVLYGQTFFLLNKFGWQKKSLATVYYFIFICLQMLLLATFFPASDTADVEPNDDIVTVSCMYVCYTGAHVIANVN